MYKKNYIKLINISVWSIFCGKYIGFTVFYQSTNTLGKLLLHPGMRYLGDYSFSYLLLRSKCRLVGRIYVFMYCMHYLFNVHFGTFVMTFIDIGEIGCMIIPKCHWVVIVGNLVKQIWFFCMILPVGVALCMPGQYRVLTSLTAIIAARRCGMLATRRCRLSTEVSSRVWRISPRFWGGLSILVIAQPNSSQVCSMGLQSGDLAGCSILVRCFAEGLPEHREVWRYGLGSGSYPRNAAWKMALRCFAKCPCTAYQWGICRGAQEAIWHHCKMLPRLVPNHHRLRP